MNWLPQLSKVLNRMRTARVPNNRHEPTISLLCPPGEREGDLNNPSGITIHPVTSNVYITDSLNHRVQIYDPNGNFISTFSNDVIMHEPCGICIFEDKVFITQNPGHYIMVFKGDGTFIHRFGSHGADSPGKFTHPYDIEIDRTNGDIYICDLFNDRIQIYTRDYYFKTMFKSKFTIRPHNIKIINQELYILNQTRLGELHHICEDSLCVTTVITQLSNPISFDIDKDGNFVVLQYYTSRGFEVLSKEGFPLRSVNVGISGMPRALVVDFKNRVWVVSKDTRSCLRIYIGALL